MIFNWLQHIAFAYPWVFFFLLVIPVMIGWYLKQQRKRQATFLVSSVKPFRNSTSFRATLVHAPFVCRVLAVACILVALARPQFRNREEEVTGEGIDIVLCIDISGSMLAEDFTPNRMEAAKQVATEFVDNRPTDRLGVVIFSGESFTQCPLTSDHIALKSQIAAIKSGLLEDGTAIGSGLATGVDRLRSSQSKSKVIILLTDGENNGGLIDPKTAKEIAKAMHVRVYTIGVGTEGYAPMPQNTPLGVVRTNEKVNIDEKLLTEIATETGGQYFRAKDNASLEKIYKDIDQLEKTKIEITSFDRYTEEFMPFAIAAAVLLLMEVLLRYRVLRKFP